MAWNQPLPSPLPDHLKVIHAPAAWANGYVGSPDVRVALFDSGIDIREGYARTHLNPKTKPKTEPKRIFLGGNFTDSSNRRKYVDEFGHGTKMAGVIGALPGCDGVVGLVPQVKIYNFKVADRDGMVRLEALSAAIDAFFQQHKDTHFHVALFALDEEVWQKDTKTTDKIFQALDDADVLTVVAASDTKAQPDLDTSPTHPARLKLGTMVVVGALDQDEGLMSNWGSKTVHLTAPGEDVSTVSPMAPVPANGSSPAAALVAGAAALLFGKDPQQPAAKVRDLLLQLTRQVPALKEKTVTGGTLDLAALG